MTDALARARWDEAYERGKYQGADAEPVPFVSEIIERAKSLGEQARGLYPGCGNGRNFLPLARAGLKIIGLDNSSVAIEQLLVKQPDLDPQPVHADFLAYNHVPAFDYLVSIQLFQHTDRDNVRHTRMFDHARDLLRNGGLLFLRVNSTATNIGHKHTVNAEEPNGSFTIRYLDGPKQGMFVHFYTPQDLEERASDSSFAIEQTPREVSIERPDGSTWSQWETIWKAT